MMKWVFSLLIIFSIVFGAINGNIAEVSNAALDSGLNTLELFFVLVSAMAVWGGIMRIAEKSGITNKISLLFRPVAKIIFKGLDTNSKAFKAITMNITANLLGLGNAATPLGMQAMQELEKEDKTKDTASQNMIVFTVINTASIQLIPTTIATMRLAHGSKMPLEILPAILIVSAISLTVGLTVAFLFNKSNKGGDKN